MHITVLSLFPEILENYFTASIFKRAVLKGILSYEIINIRDFANKQSLSKKSYCDDSPYGGGAGMILKAEPIFSALDYIKDKNKNENIKVIYPSPSGILFNQELSFKLSKIDNLIFICGRYEGLDQRVIDESVDYELSIGDYIISSGEIATLTIIDSIYRLIDGVIKKDSLLQESFNDGYLEYPQYTRPYIIKRKNKDLNVPDILLSGNHKEIEKWRFKKSIEKTKKNRSDLLKKYNRE